MWGACPHGCSRRTSLHHDDAKGGGAPDEAAGPRVATRHKSNEEVTMATVKIAFLVEKGKK